MSLYFLSLPCLQSMNDFFLSLTCSLTYIANNVSLFFTDQLKIMKQRLEDKRMKGLPVAETEVNPLDEWNPDVDGVGVQTSEMSMSGLPPCTCNAPSPTPATSVGRVFNGK